MKVINWNEDELCNWIGTDQRPRMSRSRRVYKKAFEAYSIYTEMSAKALIDEAEMEDKVSKRQRGKVKRRLEGFLVWLQTTYEKQTPRATKKLAPKTAFTYLGAIRGFYERNNFPVGKMRGIGKPRALTTRKMLRVEDVKKLLDTASNARNKAIIICLYQSGMDISTLLSLNYSDVKRELELGTKPLMLTVVRPKTNWQYRTFLGTDAINHLEAYLLERKGIRPNDPLFVTRGLGRPKRIHAQTVQKAFRSLVVRVGFYTKEELKTFTINPAGCHALRESFSKIATAVGINKNVVDYLQGHETDYSGVYTTLDDFELEKQYRKLEPSLTTRYSTITAMDRLKEQARIWNIDLDELIERKGREFAESGMGTGGGFFPDLEDPSVISGLLRDEIKRVLSPTTATNGESPAQKIVKEDELEDYLADGWRYVNSLNNGSGKCVITR